MRKRLATVLLLTCLLALAACAGSGRVQHLADQSFPSRPEDYPISITEGDYADPYLELALVKTPMYRLDQVDKAGTAELRRMARDLGGDAVIQVRMMGGIGEQRGYRFGNLSRRGSHPESRYLLTGMVVRFHRGE